MKLKPFHPLFLMLLLAFVLGGCGNRIVDTLLMVDEKIVEPPKIWEGLPEPLARVVKAAGDNGGQIRGFIEHYEQDTPKHAVAAKQVEGMCLADAAGRDLLDLTENVDQAYAMRVAVPWGPLLPEAIFVEYVAPYRVGRELFRPWRKELSERLAPRLVQAKAIPDAVAAVRLWTYEQAQFEPSRDYLAAALDTLNRAKGSGEELAILLTCALRAACVPARLGGYGSGLVEYWDGQWQLLDAVDFSDLSPALRKAADERHEEQGRALEGSALAWMSAQRKLACSREDAGRVLTVARGNWKEVAAFLLAIPAYRAEAYCAYVTHLSNRDLAALRPAQALDNVRMALAASNAKPDKEKGWNEFVMNILPDRISNEPPSMWRGTYTKLFMGYKLMPEPEARQAVRNWAQSLELTEGLPTGPTMTPLEIIKSNHVSNESERQLAERAALRALGLQ
ncbi:MAG: transglutaminase-like domain-containing protein [Proteobacteria bacterium]|nr:transglutaminase-like domain-containing protein [Pseudomonadota bacterium]